MRTALVFACLTFLAPNLVGAQPDMGFATRLPATTSVYVTTEHLGDVASAIASSNFYRAVYAIPSVSDAVAQGKFPDVVAKWNELMAGEQGPMVMAAASLVDREVVFASTGDGVRGIAPGIIQLARVALLAQEYRMGGMDRQVGERLRSVAEEVEQRFGLDPFVLAFRTQHRDMLEPMVAGLLTQLPPEIAPMVSTEQVEGIPFTTLTVLPGMFFPPENIQGVLANVVSDSLSRESVVAAYRALTLKVRLGWLDEYLVIVAEDQKGSLASQLVQGPGKTSLAELKEFTGLLERSHPHPLRRAVIDLRDWRVALEAQLGQVSDDLTMCRTLMGFAAGAGLTAEVIGEKLQEFAASSLDPELTVVSADLEQGIRFVADMYHTPQSQACAVGSKQIALASRVPASALAWSVWGGPGAAEAWRAGLDEAVKWRSMPWVTMSMPAEERVVQGKITDLMVITRDSLPGALGEEGMAVLGWDGKVETIGGKPIDFAIPEVALAFEITDRARIRALGAAYGAKISELLSQKADTVVEVPKPTSYKVKDGEKLCWEGLIPAEGNGLLPTVFLTDRYLVVSSSARLAEEVYEFTRGKGKSKEWPHPELKTLIGSRSSGAGVALVGEIAPKLLPLLGFGMAEASIESEESATTVKADVEAAVGLLQVIPQVWGHATIGGKTIHATGRVVIQDLP